MRYFYTEHLGKTAMVLFEYAEAGEPIEGFTENYIRVQMPYKKDFSNTLQKVVLQEITPEGMVLPKLMGT